MNRRQPPPADDASPPPLPGAFVERLRRILPAGRFEACLASFAAEKPVALRVNTLRATIESARAELEGLGLGPRAAPGLDEALLVDRSARARVVDSPPVAEGRLYIQGLSSMLAARLLDPQPGEEVLDLAAAPGGKTLHLAALMRDEGRIAAVEPIRRRYYKLQANLRRGGATIVRTYRADGRSIGRRAPERFDRVLLDAPCSGEARFDRRRPRSWRAWSLRKIRECARKQRGLLRSALAALRPGGTLLYCTCSFAPEENELVVDECLRRAGEGIEIAPIELPVAAEVQPGWTRWEDRPLHPDLALAARILPDERFDGFFFCKLVKRAGRAGRFRRRGRRESRTREEKRRRGRLRGEPRDESFDP